ncbi:hypothetical protein MMC30_000862 [Trapelia coarctata]|nr:hypothetical protein [Trapelia coarctata]
MSSPSYLVILLKTYFYRFIASIFVTCDIYLSTPIPPAHAFTVDIPTSNPKTPGKIPLLFYVPNGYKRLQQSPGTPHKLSARKPLPVVLDFHGGGYIIGAPHDDARWAAAVTRAGAVCISVGYRLAPEYPYPTANKDGVDALRWVIAHAAEYNLDPSRIVLSGFSAGGGLTFAVPMLLHAQETAAQNAEIPKIAGILAFYPGVNRTLSTAEKIATNTISATRGVIPSGLAALFVQGYFYGQDGLDKSAPSVSPALAPEELLKATLPQKIYIHTCEWDWMLVEAEVFRERLMAVGKSVSGGMGREVAHGWDRKPNFWRRNVPRDDLYGEAVGELKGMVGL